MSWNPLCYEDRAAVTLIHRVTSSDGQQLAGVASVDDHTHLIPVWANWTWVNETLGQESAELENQEVAARSVAGYFRPLTTDITKRVTSVQNKKLAERQREAEMP